MEFGNMPLSGFSDALASGSPVPGGGGAAALCASLAAALGSMVGNITTASGSGAPETGELTEKSERLRRELLGLVDADAEAFMPLSRAYAMPKNTPEREELMERCLNDAAAVPMKVLEKCCELIELAEGFAALGRRSVISDAGTGAVLAWGAMYAAGMNVLANTSLMKDRARAGELNSRVDALMGEYWKRADGVYEGVYALLRRNGDADGERENKETGA